MCNLPAAIYAYPNQAMGEKLRTKAPDPTLTPQQAAMKLRDQMVEQVTAMVNSFRDQETKGRRRRCCCCVSLVLIRMTWHALRSMCRALREPLKARRSMMFPQAAPAFRQTLSYSGT